MQRIGELQNSGWVRAELDPDEVRRQLFGAVYAAAMALLADASPAERERQLAELDALLEEMSAG